MAPGIVDVDSATNGVATPKSLAPGTSHHESSNPDHEEHQYLSLIQDIIDNGEHRPDRSARLPYKLHQLIGS